MVIINNYFLNHGKNDKFTYPLKNNSIFKITIICNELTLFIRIVIFYFTGICMWQNQPLI